MIWENVLVSAAISAIVGAFISVLAVSRMTVGRMRAERAENARQAIRDTVRPLQLDVLRYQTGHKDMRREANTFHSDDLLIAAGVLEEAQGVGRIRHYLVVRRCRRIFGTKATEIAGLYNGKDDALKHGAWVVPLFASAVSSTGEPVTFLDGLWHRALSAENSAELLPKLRRELGWLASSR